MILLIITKMINFLIRDLTPLYNTLNWARKVHSNFNIVASTIVRTRKGVNQLKWKLRKFVDSLPIPETLKPTRKHANGDYYEIEMRDFQMKMHRDLRPTRLWGYNGQFPGPIIDVNEGEAVQVKWQNKLPPRHFLPVDKTIHDLERLP